LVTPAELPETYAQLNIQDYIVSRGVNKYSKRTYTLVDSERTYTLVEGERTYTLVDSERTYTLVDSEAEGEYVSLAEVTMIISKYLLGQVSAVPLLHVLRGKYLSDVSKIT